MRTADLPSSWPSWPSWLIGETEAVSRRPSHRPTVPPSGRLGYSPKEMLALLGSLSLPQIYAALAYALANPGEMDEALRKEEETLRHLAAPQVA